ncbi:MAG: TetR/AcrR family transcriptional regulator [Bacteroidales bacterium]|nr:TetR/AcrR family transcriptional regulator [Bacteroidales bacterium]
MNNTKEHILQTSLMLFLQKSYRDVTMSEIVEKTALSKGAFYHYFNSKEALFKEVTEMIFSMGQVKYETFDHQSLFTFYHDYAEFLNDSLVIMQGLSVSLPERSNSLNFFLIMFEAVSRFPEFLEKELEMHKQDLNQWKKVINNARLKNEIKSGSNDEEIADLFLYCTDGVFIRYVNNNDPKAYKDYLLGAFNSIYQNLRV